MTATFLLGFLASAVVLQIIRYVVNSWQLSRKARSLGCANPPLLPSKDPFGITSVREILQAGKEHMVPRLIEGRYKTLSKLENRPVTTMKFQGLGTKHVHTVDPKNVQAVLATQFKDFELGPPRQKGIRPFLGLGIFTADGADWSHSRTLLRPQFTREQISQLDLEEKHVQKAMLALPVAGNGWTAATDIQSIFFRLTMDSATEFFFGKSVESQTDALNGLEAAGDNFAAYFDKSQVYCTKRLRLEGLQFLVDNKESRHAQNKVYEFVDKIIEERLSVMDSEKKVSDEEKAYVFLEGLASETRDPLELRSQLLNILLAGRDTTASLLSWTLLMLARNPETFQKLRQVILETFGTWSKPHDLTFAALKSCQYLQYCMNEALRIYPVVPFNRRVATRDTSIPRGGGPDGMSPVFIPKGDSVMYSTFIMHRRKDIWGDDVEEYKPERWANRKAGWEYLPFNGGPRICIGQQFALTEAGYVLVRLLQRFDQVEDVNSDKPIRFGFTLTMAPADLLTVRLHEAADA